MYYINTNLADTNSWQHTTQVQDWQNQRNRDHARNVSTNWAKGWTFVDVQFTGNHYKVHYRDHSGHYRTVFMDTGFRFQQSQDRYC